MSKKILGIKVERTDQIEKDERTMAMGWAIVKETEKKESVESGQEINIENPKELARKKVGEFLRAIREEKGISTYQMTKSHGIRFEAIQSIEEGSSNYTIDNFLTYISAIDCYFYLENRNDEHLNHNDMISKMEGGKKRKEKE